MREDCLFHLLLHVFEVSLAAWSVLGNLQDHIPLFGANRRGKLARFQVEGLIFELFGQHAAAEFAEVSATGCRRSARRGFGQRLETGSSLELLLDSLGFLLRGGHLRGIGRASRRGGNENFSQMD